MVVKIKKLTWLFMAALGAAPIAVDAQHYKAIELNVVEVYGINASGQVTGSVQIGNAVSAFITNATTNAIIVLNDLGGGSSEGFGVNASGQVTGLSYLPPVEPPSAPYHAFINNSKTNTVIDLGSVDGGNSWGAGINASGQVTGFDGVHAFITNAATNAIIDLGTLGSAQSVGTAINDSGQVTGYDGEYGNPTHAFITNAKTNAMTDLGTLGGTVSAGLGINASGQVTGYSYTAGNLFTHAFITNAATHAMTDLGTLGGTGSEGLGINASGQVTGYAVTATGLGGHGFLYSNGHMLDLNSLLSPTQAAQYTITAGVSINDSGQIAASGYDNTTSPPRYVSFLLTPIAPLTLECPTGSAQVGIAYSSALSAAGGVSPYTFSNTGVLPGGLTLNAGTGAVTGTPTTAGAFSFTAKVVDSSGLAAGTVTASCTITIRPAPNFSISASPSSLSIVQGSAGTSLITTNALYGFAGSIKLQQAGAPTGTSVTFLPASVSAGSTSQMQVTVDSSTAAGTYPVAVTGMSGALSHMTTVSLTVTASPLKLSATPSSLSFGTVRRFSLHFKSVTLMNTGTAAVTISGVSVNLGAGTAPHDFTPISLCGRTLEAGRSCEIVVVLFAEHVGSLSATLNIANDAVTSPQSVSLSAGVIQYWWGQPMESPAKRP
jgi:probable HAF family extracellular repeat protein